VRGGAGRSGLSLFLGVVFVSFLSVTVRREIPLFCCLGLVVFVFFSRVLVPLVVCHGEVFSLDACGRLETELAGTRRLGTPLAGKRRRVVHLLTAAHPCRMPPCTRWAHEES